MSCLPTQKTPNEMRFRDTPESKVRERVAKASKNMDLRGRKGAYRAIVLDIWHGIFVEVMDEGSRTSRHDGNPLSATNYRRFPDIRDGRIWTKCPIEDRGTQCRIQWFLSRSDTHHQMSPSPASEASSDGHTFVPLNEDAYSTDRIASERGGASRASPRDILPRIAPALRNFSGSPLSRAGCVLSGFFKNLLNYCHP